MSTPDEGRIEAALFEVLPRWERDVKAGYVIGERRGPNVTLWWFDAQMGREPDRHVATISATERVFKFVGLSWSRSYKGRNWQERLGQDLAHAVLELIDAKALKPGGSSCPAP